MMLGNFHVVVVVLFIKPIAVFFTFSLLLPSSGARTTLKIKKICFSPKLSIQPCGPKSDSAISEAI